MSSNRFSKYLEKEGLFNNVPKPHRYNYVRIIIVQQLMKLIKFDLFFVIHVHFCFLV